MLLDDYEANGRRSTARAARAGLNAVERLGGEHAQERRVQPRACWRAPVGRNGHGWSRDRVDLRRYAFVDETMLREAAEKLARGTVPRRSSNPMKGRRR